MRRWSQGSGFRVQWFSGLRLTALFFVLSVLSAARAARAADLLSGRLYTVPEKVYVNQPFEIRFDLEVTAGADVEDLRISDFPNDPAVLALGRLESAARTSASRDGQNIHVLHFTATGRGLKPIAQTFNPRLQCSLVQRRSAGFFSQWQSSPRQLQLAPFNLRIQPLPAEGRPGSFGGAVGAFRLSGRLSQETVRPGDIVTLTLDLEGQGWLGDAPAPAPADSPHFKTYPAKERLREPLHLRSEQVFIPQSTNATEIAAARFSYFNPATGRYEETQAGPFRLAFSDAAAAPQANAVRVIDTARPASPEAPAPAVSLERVHMTLRQALPLLAGSAGAIAAFFVFFLLYGRHTRLAIACGAALLAAGLAAAYAVSGKAETNARVTAAHTEARLAPSQSAVTLFSLIPGTAVTPLETAGSWVRVDAGGRRGWISSDALGDRSSAGEPQADAAKR